MSTDELRWGGAIGVYPVPSVVPGTDNPSKQAEAEFSAGQSLYAAGRIEEALSRYRAAVRLNPAVARYHRQTGVSYWHLGHNDPAREHLENSARIDPADPRTQEALSWLHSAFGNRTEAMRHALRAAELSPNDSQAAMTLASVLAADGQSAEAWNLVNALRARGHRSVRLAALMARLGPRHGAADQALSMVEEILQAGQFRHAREEAALAFMAAQLLDGAGRFDEAFAMALRGNRLTGARYVPQRMEAFVDALISYHTPATLSRLPRARHGSRAPVFVVGMPRSGTTLVEQVLASHPQVFGAGELPWMHRIARQLDERFAPRGLCLPRSLDHLSPGEIEELAHSYLQPVSAMSPDATYVIDKQTTNFLLLGLISLLFPEAKVIHCRRHPADTCLSCFMTDFAVGNEFSTSLATCGHYYLQYKRLMAHWKEVVPLPILEVDYEQMVRDLEGQARRMIDFLGLGWEDRCLQFHESKRFVVTASTEQVRRPLYRSSVGRWRNYERHLASLRATLGWG